MAVYPYHVSNGAHQLMMQANLNTIQNNAIVAAGVLHAVQEREAPKQSWSRVRAFFGLVRAILF